MDKQVNAKLKRELDAVFSAESKNIANELILESFGPGPYDDAEAKNRIQRIMDRCRANAYAALRGPWGVHCPNCNLRHSYIFDDGMIQILVTKSLLRVGWKNKGLLMFHHYQNSSNIHGVVEFTLREVIRTYLLAE